MKKIIIAGAGHGGLTAAYNLADKGYDITVIECKQRDELGYDWHDLLDHSAFDDSGIPRPSEDMIRYGVPTGFTNPSSTVKLKIPFEYGSGYTMDRKVLLSYLVENAENKGVKFIFEAKVICAITQGAKVTGIKYETKDGVTEEKCDLVIDAAGMNSPVRENLPAGCGIQNSLECRDVFYVYRVYFDNTTGEMNDPPYTISLFHNNRPGIDWIITEKDSVDILVGKFGSSSKLTYSEIDEAIADYRKQYPFVGEKVLRGGSKGEIPLRRMFPVIVCDGYAAIGDSAGMTVPLNGSGIVLSMKAGKILADTILEIGEKTFTKERLWKYEYTYFQTLGKGLVIIDILKNFFTYVSGKQVDFFLEKEILTEKELGMGDGQDYSVTPKKVLQVMSVSLPIANLLPVLIRNFKFAPFIGRIASQMPKEYDKEKVEKWVKKYNAL